MAKKKKHPPANGAGATSEQLGAKGHSAKPSAADEQAAPSQLERAFRAGNYAAVRKLARANPGPEAERLLALVKVSHPPLWIGAGALLFLTIVALLVLRTG